MDCSGCYYPNDDDARFCVRCAAALGLPPDRLPDQPAPEPLGLDGACAHEGPASRGDLLGGCYRLLRRIGGGGFGAVYEAEHTSLGIRLAVKLLNRASLRDARVRARFLDEARMVARLRNPHVVVLHDYNVTDEGTPYLVMEFLEGRDVGGLLCEGVFGRRRALFIAAQICQALGEAHSLGIVHRDMKPENVMLVQRGADPDFVKVVDFGVAKLLDGASTRTSAILGTPAYVSPEMLANEPIDGRSDLYALGIMLWEMIVGRLPFPGENQAVMLTSHLQAERRWPRELDPRLHLEDELEHLLTRLVARDPGERPRTAYALRAQLLDLAGRVPDLALDVPPPLGGPGWDPLPAA